jgi:hypothetical protein
MPSVRVPAASDRSLRYVRPMRAFGFVLGDLSADL